MPKNPPQDAVEPLEPAPEVQETPEPVEPVLEAPEAAPEPEEEDEPGDLDPEAYIMGTDGEPKPMPSGEWTAAVTDKGNLRRSKGLLVEA